MASDRAAEGPVTRCANRPHGRRCPHAGTERPRFEPRIAFCAACVDSRLRDLRATVDGPEDELRYEALADLEADHGVALERLTRLERRRAWRARWAELGLCPVRPCEGAASAYDVAEQTRCRGVSRAWCSSAARFRRAS